jgi:benzoyl-CoA reductase subunit B
MVELQLQASQAARAYQRQWFAELRREVFEARKPYVILNADCPADIFQSMNVPTLTNQWWSAVIASRGMAEFYSQGLSELGFTKDLCRYCSMGLASTLVNAGDRAPWGGLPKPAMLVTKLGCDCMQRVFRLWSEAFGSPVYMLEATGATEMPIRWWEACRSDWESFLETHRLDHMHEQFLELIEVAEAATGQVFKPERLREVLTLVNQQQEYYDDIRTLMAEAPRCPIRIAEAQGTAMIAQWHRGSQWAVDHAKAFRDEVAERVRRGEAAYQGEQKRLMWIGAGLWHKPQFYEAFEQRYGAVFTWAEYPSFGPDCYLRYHLEDPVRALASRYVVCREWLHDPPWAGEWYAHEARRNRIDGAVILVPVNSRPSATGSYFIRETLEAAGVPVQLLWADMIDPSGWDDSLVQANISKFIEERVL